MLWQLSPHKTHTINMVLQLFAGCVQIVNIKTCIMLLDMCPAHYINSFQYFFKKNSNYLTNPYEHVINTVYTLDSNDFKFRMEIAVGYLTYL